MKQIDWDEEQRELLRKGVEAHEECLKPEPQPGVTSVDSLTDFAEASKRSDEAGRRLSEFLEIRLRENLTCDRQIRLICRGQACTQFGLERMPLVPTREPGVYSLWEVNFVMLNSGLRVLCSVEASALDEIENAQPDKAERLRIFERNREMLERIASNLYDLGYRPNITTDHLSRLSGLSQ